jgi:DNA-binding beta-propeller fold protein YncE
MSDFISELRGDLVEAAARHGRRGRLERAARVAHPRAWRPRIAVAGLAVAAGLAAVVLSVAALAPPERAAQPRVVAVVRVGGIPVDATFAGGSLWVADFGHRIVRVDLRTRRIVARIPLPSEPVAVASGSAGVWIRTRDIEPASNGTRLFALDARTNRAVARASLGAGLGLDVGASAVWTARETLPPDGIYAIDPRNGALIGHTPMPNAGGVAVGGAALWAIGTDGTLARIDPASRRLVARLPRLAPMKGPGGTVNHVLAADGDGVWVLNSRDGQVIRVVGSRVVRRYAVDRSVHDLLARTADGLWIVTGADRARDNRLTRIDPETGKVTATLELGTHQPVALVGSGRTLYVAGGDGTVLVIRP